MVNAISSRALRRLGAAFLLIAVAHAAEAGSRHGQHPEGVLAHLRAFQDIADGSGGNRASGTPGYDRSAQYVAERLRQAGYEVRFEEFTFPFFEERSPPILLPLTPPSAQIPAHTEPVRTLVNSGAGEVTARLRPVALGLSEGTSPQTSASGCTPEDFDGFERGAVALVRRGTCPFQAKVDNAAGAGAVGVVVMNEGTDRRADSFRGTLMRPANIPVVGVPFEFGRSLAAAASAGDGLPVQLAVHAQAGTRATHNVLAESGGDPARTIVVGAHLDSAPEGPGINDNGSGSAAVLETALRLAKATFKPATRVRFAFWGAEERGLIGSRHHVATLSEEERGRVGLYINLDMVGSPNFGRFVSGPEAGPDTLSGAARRALVSYFRDRGLPVEDRMARRQRGFGSDDASFTDKGIAAIALHTGAGEAKSEAYAALFGGTAGHPYDPCYHQACDTVRNIDLEVLEQMTAALAHTLGILVPAEFQPGPP